MKRHRNPKVSFHPEKGLLVQRTVKEQIKNLLDGGYFDDVDSMVIGVSSSTRYDAQWTGCKFDCKALACEITVRLGKE